MSETTANVSRIGRFTLSRRLGKDSIATVYRARDSRDDREVAIKLIHSQIDSGKALQEIRDKQMDQVRHPAICRLCSVDQHQGLSYLAYEFAEGESLARLLAGKSLRGRDKLPLMRALVEGIAALHEHGICHLGVTPERIKVAADKTPKILGIGRSSLLDAAGHSTMVERGELRYMAPEQLDAGEVDERTDVFRLSLVLFEILARKPALKPTSTKEAREQLKNFSLRPDALGTSRAAMKLMAFLNKGLATDPAQRYRNAAQMLAAMPKMRSGNQSPAAEQASASDAGPMAEKAKLSAEDEHDADAKPDMPAGEQSAAAELASNEQPPDADTTDVSADESVQAGHRVSDTAEEQASDNADDNQEQQPAANEQDSQPEELNTEPEDGDRHSDGDGHSDGESDSPEKSEGESDDKGEKTTAYVLDRLAKSNDFPSLSQSVFEVNQLTSLQANATVSQIAEVILRDYALSNELLKLANSAYYGVRVEVTRVSDAIRLLGFEQVRITANGLAYTGKIGPGMEQLRDAMLKSFASGLVARQLAEDVRLDDSEEAFLCAMFHDTGEHLTIHYLPDEHNRIVQLLESGQVPDQAEAATQVLGLTFTSLGAAVARSWRFPEKIVTAIEGKTADGEPLEDDQLIRLSWITRGANDLCELAGRYSPDAADPAMLELVKRLGEYLPLDADLLKKALFHAAEKTQAFAPVLGIDANNSDYMQALTQWGPPPSEDSQDADPRIAKDNNAVDSDNEARKTSSSERQDATRCETVS